MDIKELQEMNIHELVEVARGMNIEAVSTLRKSELIFKILEGQTEKNGLIYAEGVLQVLAEGYGFLRSAKYNYLPGPDDIYLSPVADQEVRPEDRRHDQRAGASAEGERALLRAAEGRVRQLQGPGECEEGHAFRQPHAAVSGGRCSTSSSRARTMTTRLINLLAPIGKGQRGLIVSPPRAGKTVILQKIANAITTNHPEIAPDRAADRRASRGSHRHGALGQGRGRQLDLRRAGRAPRPGGQHGARQEPAPGRERQGRGDPAGLDHPPRPRPQRRGAALGQDPLRRRRLQRPAEAQAVLRRGAQHRGRAVR